MIFDLIVGVLVSIFTGVLSLFPSFDFDGFELASSVGGWVGTANGFFPLYVVTGCLLAILGLRAFMFVVRAIVFIWDKFPFKAT